jgi:hypothetical protein
MLFNSTSSLFSHAPQGGFLLKVVVAAAGAAAGAAGCVEVVGYQIRISKKPA